MTIKKDQQQKTTHLFCADDFKKKGNKHYRNQPKFLFNLNSKN